MSDSDDVEVAVTAPVTSVIVNAGSGKTVDSGGQVTLGRQHDRHQRLRPDHDPVGDGDRLHLGAWLVGRYRVTDAHVDRADARKWEIRSCMPSGGSP